MSRRVPPGNCLRCGAPFDGWTGVGRKGDVPRAPQPGDATVCIECGTAMIYTADLRLRWPTVTEQAALDRDELVGISQSAIHQVHGRKRQ